MAVETRSFRISELFYKRGGEAIRDSHEANARYLEGSCSGDSLSCSGSALLLSLYFLPTRISPRMSQHRGKSSIRDCIVSACLASSLERTETDFPELVLQDGCFRVGVSVTSCPRCIYSF